MVDTLCQLEQFRSLRDSAGSHGSYSVNILIWCKEGKDFWSATPALKWGRWPVYSINQEKRLALLLCALAVLLFLLLP